MKQLDWIEEEEKKLKVLKDLAKWLDGIKDDPIGTMHGKAGLFGILKIQEDRDEPRVYKRIMRKHGRR